MSSIFNRIFRYRQREKRTPREDYFTETFVAVIKKYDELRIALFAWLAEEELQDIQSVRIETQRRFTIPDSGNSRRPDIWMEATDTAGARHWIIVENKIDSGEGENQLADYAKVLEGALGLKSRTLVYITKYSSGTDHRSNEKVKFKHLRWSKVFNFLQSELQDANDRQELAVELLRLMEDWNMDGKLSTAHLRAAVICFDSGIGNKLTELQNEAFTSSGLGDLIDSKMNGKKWSYTKQDRGAQSASEIPGCGIGLWMGFRFDRRDEVWSVDTFELPSPAVAVHPYGENDIGMRLERPSENWIEGVEGLDSWIKKWVRQPVDGEAPRMGEPLDEYYKNFFHKAFEELKQALEEAQ